MPLVTGLYQDFCPYFLKDLQASFRTKTFLSTGRLQVPYFTGAESTVKIVLTLYDCVSYICICERVMLALRISKRGPATQGLARETLQVTFTTPQSVATDKCEPVVHHAFARNMIVSSEDVWCSRTGWPSRCAPCDAPVEGIRIPGGYCLFANSPDTRPTSQTPRKVT